jgi:SAM-dependent methyltransferase
MAAELATGTRAGEEVVRASYERIGYPASPQPLAHPDNLAVLAVLAGLEPAPPGRCQVLELGAADGGNLIPMAVNLPGSRFVGIDLVPEHVERGRRRAAALGIGNLELRAASVLDLGSERGEELGTFDYVIAHGIFSWVAAPVQEAILAVCRRHMGPHGVAYVSYNTWPGWYARSAARELMLLASPGDADPTERVRRGVEAVQRFAAATAPDGGTHALALAEAAAHLESQRERVSYLVHEYLDEDNAPLWFRQFADRAAQHGLQYLGEANKLAVTAALPPAVEEALLGAGRIEREQARDLLTGRTFRRSLLCHREVVLDEDRHSGMIARIPRLWTAAEVEPAEDAFKTPGGRTVRANHPAVRASLTELGAVWPRALSFPELLGRVGSAPRNLLANLLRELAVEGVVDLHFEPLPCTGEVGERPRATPLARREAAEGPLVTNQLHRPLKIDDEVARLLLAHLDGTRDRAALVAVLARALEEGRLSLSWEAKPVERSTPSLHDLLGRIVDHHLRKLARLALIAA